MAAGAPLKEAASGAEKVELAGINAEPNDWTRSMELPHESDAVQRRRMPVPLFTAVSWY